MKKQAAIQILNKHLNGSPSKTSKHILAEICGSLEKNGFKPPFHLQTRAQIIENLDTPEEVENAVEQEVEEQQEEQVTGIPATVDLTAPNPPYVLRWTENVDGIDQEQTVNLPLNYEAVQRAYLGGGIGTLNGTVTTESDPADPSARTIMFDIPDATLRSNLNILENPMTIEDRMDSY